jgi:hypothetical protein
MIYLRHPNELPTVGAIATGAIAAKKKTTPWQGAAIKIFTFILSLPPLAPSRDNFIRANDEQ